MADTTNNKFNGGNEREEMNERFHEEHDKNQDEITKTENELSLENSVRNFGDVNGSTFGADSNTAKFSNLGDKNQARKGEGDQNNR